MSIPPKNPSSAPLTGPPGKFGPHIKSILSASAPILKELRRVIAASKFDTENPYAKVIPVSTVKVKSHTKNGGKEKQELLAEISKVKEQLRQKKLDLEETKINLRTDVLKNDNRAGIQKEYESLRVQQDRMVQSCNELRQKFETNLTEGNGMYRKMFTKMGISLENRGCPEGHRLVETENCTGKGTGRTCDIWECPKLLAMLDDDND